MPLAALALAEAPVALALGMSKWLLSPRSAMRKAESLPENSEDQRPYGLLTMTAQSTGPEARSLEVRARLQAGSAKIAQS